MNTLQKLIIEVEEHTGEPFDFSNKKDLLRLNNKIERLHENELRILNLIKQSLESNQNENSLYNSSMQYTKNRYNHKA
jgi:hypothetical protein